MASLQAGVAYIDIHPQMDQFNRALSRGVNTKLGSISRSIGKGLKFAAVGFTALGGAAAYAFSQFEESEKISKQTEAVIKSTGGAANATAGQIGNLADKISRYSGIDDEAIQSGENMLLTFTHIRNEVGKGNDIFDQAAKSAVDLGVALGTDSKQAALQLGKALNDPIKGIGRLSRSGVDFSEAQKKQIETLVKHNDLLGAQKIILKEVNKEFGGSAKAQATASGKMKVALGNLAEDAGKLLAPVLTVIVDKISVLAQWLGKHLPGALKAAQEWFQKVWDAIKPAVDIILPMLQDAVKAVWEAIKQDLWPALKDLWNALKPVLKVVGAVIGILLILALKVLPVAIRILGKLIGFVLRVYGAFFKVVGFVGKVGVAIGGAILAGWNHVKNWGGKILTFFKELPGKVMGFLKSLPSKFGQLFSAVAHAIVDWWNRIDIGFHLDLNLPGPLPDIHVGIDDIIPDVHLAKGGIVTRRQLAMVGESGPEAVVPLGGRGQLHVIVDNPHDFTNDNENVRLDRRMARSER